MDPTNRPLNTLDPGEVDSYIDAAIDQLFVPKVATAAPEPEPSPPPGPAGTLADPRTSPTGTAVPELEALHEVLLSLEWEVSERNIREFEGEVRALGGHFAGDRHVSAVVQMALGVGKYLRAVGEAASPLGVQFPTATLRTLEILLRDPAPAPAERKAAVEHLLDSYRRLQSEVRRQPPKPPPETEPTVEPEAPPPRDEAEPARFEAQVSAAAEPAEDLEPEAEGPVEELEPEAEEALEPAEEPEAVAAEELEPETLAEELAGQGEPDASAAEAAPETAPELLGAPEIEPPRLPDDAVSVLEADETLGEEPLEVPAPAEISATPEMPPPSTTPAAEGPREASARLISCLGALRTDVREGLDRAFRAASSGTEELDAELTQFRYLLDEGLASALGIAEGLAPALEGLPWQPPAPAGPAAPTAQFAGDLEQVRQALETLAATVRDMEGRLAAPAKAEAAPPAPPQARGREAPADAVVAPFTPPEAAAEVPAYLTSVGGRPTAIRVELLANAFPLTQGQASRIRERGYATLKDFRKPFRSLKSGLAGPLAAFEGKELERLRFPLVSEAPGDGGTPNGAVLLSDGRNHAVLLTDSGLDRTPRSAPKHQLFLLSAEAGPRPG